MLHEKPGAPRVYSLSYFNLHIIPGYNYFRVISDKSL